QVSSEWSGLRAVAMRLLQEESELQEIVRLVGIDALSIADRMILETTKSIREDYLHQNAFHDVDTYASLDKQYRMLKLILTFHTEAMKAIEAGAEFRKIIDLPVREQIARAKYIPEEQIDEISTIEKVIKEQLEALVAEGGTISA
ncbi:MAG TPA: V-type ATP synthase subunit A, partial [Thermoanaerobacterales bacterium]|nr:V-type ATP synthase subunit A [Thermoanaerobacterales bacterium]